MCATRLHTIIHSRLHNNYPYVPLAQDACCTRIPDNVVGGDEVGFVVKHIHQAEGEHAEHVQRQRVQEEEEVAIVTLANTVVHPRTMVVKRLQSKPDVECVHVCLHRV